MIEAGRLVLENVVMFLELFINLIFFKKILSIHNDFA